MLATENLSQKNYLPQNFPATEPADEENFGDSVTFTPLELKYYNAEIAEMLAEGKIIDVPKAIHNAKYFAELEDRIASLEAGHWTEHELIEDDDDE